MKEYISTIIYVCIFSIILELILPDNKLKKYVGVLISLIVILVLISPVVNFLKNEDIIATISSTVEDMNISLDNTISYNFEDYKDKVVLGNVKDKLEEEIENSCKEEFNNVQIIDVKILLSTTYEIENLVIYTENIKEVETARNIITFIEEKYNINENITKVVQGE